MSVSAESVVLKAAAPRLSHLDDAERLPRQSIAIREKSVGHTSGATARGLFDLASILAMRNKNTEAEAAYRESLRLREMLLAACDKTVDPTLVPLTMHGLGQHLARLNRLPEAEALMRRSLTMRRRLEHPATPTPWPSSTSARSSNARTA
jgi:hypothetical protein